MAVAESTMVTDQSEVPLLNAAYSNDDAIPRFWRDDALPHIEGRSVQDGRKVCYARHTHETFSIGAVINGRSTYLNGRSTAPIGAGTIVIIDPEQLHACNPIASQRWAYRMLYVDVAWLGSLQHELGFSRNTDYQGFSATASSAPALYRGLLHLYATLADPHADPLEKSGSLVSYFSMLHQRLNPAPAWPQEDDAKLSRVAEYIREHCTQEVRLDTLCAQAQLSASYLIRAFKRRYGMTPHAYLMDRRIDYCRSQLKRKRSIADVAAEAGFSDQAHLQRAFRRYVAATPGQYRDGMCGVNRRASSRC